jgi:acetyl esterase/lipase
VLIYRLPREGWRSPALAPLEDAERAMRLIRANAARFGIDPRRLGVLGFSAGGHLMGLLATGGSVSPYAAVDSAGGVSAAPAFAALIYPVITMLPPFAHEASREMLLGERPSHSERAAWSCEQRVTAATPPVFLVAAADDPDVAPDNSLQMFAALRRARVPAELHMFERGGHGFGIGAPGEPIGAWPDLLLHWGASHGFFGAGKTR